jgi:uncharacterized protein with LGFP repeats
MRYRLVSTTEKGTELPKPKLSYEDAVLFLEKAVADRGADYVYPHQLLSPSTGQQNGDEEETGCVYFDHETNQPSCIIGHVFSYMGIAALDVRGYEGQTVQVLAGSESRLGLFDADETTVGLLARAQSFQDTRHSWGESLRYALDPDEEYNV